ncbi:DUF3990 domain-containing protein [Rhizophagus clarus]|nr:DUF3990 domain-containing protein [Rhizophagus clarus]
MSYKITFKIFVKEVEEPIFTVKKNSTISLDSLMETIKKHKPEVFTIFKDDDILKLWKVSDEEIPHLFNNTTTKMEEITAQNIESNVSQQHVNVYVQPVSENKFEFCIPCMKYISATTKSQHNKSVTHKENESIANITEEESQQSGKELVITIVNQAERLGFHLNKFSSWLISISTELLPTQSSEYWINSYVTDYVLENANFWDENSLPRDWLLKCFDITEETADIIINQVSEEYLKKQSPLYWIQNWIKQQTNQPSPEFLTFIENAKENALCYYQGALYSRPIYVVDKRPDIKETNEINHLLATEFGQQTNESSLFYHTTNIYGAERIITQGIDFGECNRRQDFGGTTVSYYLNDNFKRAIEFGRHRYIKSCAIIVYYIPVTLLEQHDHLDLGEDNNKWKKVVHRSRSGLSNEVDDYDSAYGPQATNGAKLLNDPNLTLKASVGKNQLAIKTRKLSKKVDSNIVGVIIYRN